MTHSERYLHQVAEVAQAIDASSVERLADSVALLKSYPNVELIRASSRDLWNVFQADSVGCPIITVTPDPVAKLPLVGKDLDRYSLETVAMFGRDALEANLIVETAPQPSSGGGA